ncbi:hypothetical protein JQ596_34275 [Bradyrhizobium manausense]|uniref:hypothetical protein n=1 Tax=Bradyrhizobium TaxID=374 RepID=UPI001BAD4479|nr:MULTISPECIES: hypothetical protein [Bradyrhizobium]MBR0830587.1 hypothetical protein [Bradyrhizobium manausense]UVO28187.1 hypothetical protein KUF59_37915 [Bradyrhizobium arachidis]
MSSERDGHRTTIGFVAIAVVIAILAAFVSTLARVDTRTANNETPPGTTGLAKPRPPLDRAPGEALTGGASETGRTNSPPGTPWHKP